MTKSNQFSITFLGSILTGMIGAVLKIMHSPAGYFFLILTLLLTVAYVILALYEIYKAKNITTNEKVMWTVGFLFFITLAGLLYFFMGQHRITRKYKMLTHLKHS